MSISNHNIEEIPEFDRRYGNTHIDNVWVIFFFILADVFIFSREHLESGAGWAFMIIIVLYTINVFGKYANYWIKQALMAVRRFLIEIGRVAMKEGEPWRTIVVSAGAGCAAIFFAIGAYNLSEGIYILLPWISSAIFFLIFVVVPLAAMYMYHKHRNHC